MFKKSKIAAAIIAAAAATSAQAVHVNQNGTGQVLIFPYYNTNAGFSTSFTITNTTGLYKAVKVRLRESKGSNDVLDFNVYMSPWDQWSGGLSKDAAGKATLTSLDKTCTYPNVPALLEAGVNLIDAYAAVDAEDLSEGYIEVIEMGVIADGPQVGSAPTAADGDEFAETGEDGVLDGTPGLVGTGGTTSTTVVAGLKHDTNGVPADCTVVTRAFTNFGFTQGYLAAGVADDGAPADPYQADAHANATNPQNHNNGLVAPTGGLSGFSAIIKLDDGSAFIADAAVIDNYSTMPQHFLPDDQVNYLLPSLASGNVFTAETANDVTAGVNVAMPTTSTATEFDTGLVNNISPRASVPAGANPFAIANALAVTAISNDYIIDKATFNGRTDWVMTLPMKKHGVFNSGILNHDLDGTVAVCVGTLTQTIVRPGSNLSDPAYNYTHVFDTVPVGTGQCETVAVPEGGTNDFATTAQITANGSSDLIGFNDRAKKDVEFSFSYYDDEEGEPSVVPGEQTFSPPPVAAVTPKSTLVREVNVARFINASDSDSIESVLGTPVDNLVVFGKLEAKFVNGWGKMSFAPEYVLTQSHTSFLLAAPLGMGGAPAANEGINGVPLIGFSALNIGLDASKALGETIPHTRYTDLTPGANGAAVAGADATN